MTGSLALMAALTVALALSFMLSGMEAGIPLVSRLRLRLRLRQGSASAKALQRLLDRPEEFLWTILVGNTLASFVLLCAALFLLHAWLGGQRWLLLGALAVVAFLLYAVGDLLPKMLFRTFPNRLCLAVARPFQGIHLALRPLVAPVTWLANRLLRLTGGRQFEGRLFGSRDELRWLMQESEQALTREERTLVNRVLDLQQRTIGSVMTPLAKVITVPADLPLHAFLRLCRETGRQRFPVCEPATGSVVGVISLRAALYREELDPDQPVKDLMREVFRLEPSWRLEEALPRFQRSGHRLAVVVDGAGQMVGLITLSDLLRRLFGEVAL
jgi:CBS domain containing-hemolysin-like protein